MRLEVLMGNKISEKFVLTNEGSLKGTLVQLTFIYSDAHCSTYDLN
jgi:hypothetical protein